MHKKKKIEKHVTASKLRIGENYLKKGALSVIGDIGRDV